MTLAELGASLVGQDLVGFGHVQRAVVSGGKVYVTVLVTQKSGLVADVTADLRLDGSAWSLTDKRGRVRASGTLPAPVVTLGDASGDIIIESEPAELGPSDAGWWTPGKIAAAFLTGLLLRKVL